MQFAPFLFRFDLRFSVLCAIRRFALCVNKKALQRIKKKTRTLLKVRTAAKRSAGLGDEQKSCRTDIAGGSSVNVVLERRTIAEAAS